MDREDIHVVVVELQQSVVMRGIKNKLKELKFQVTEIDDDEKEISRYCGKVDLFVLYLSESIVEHAGAVQKITNVIEDTDMDDQKMVLVGEKDFLDNITKKISDLKKFERFLLPIDTERLGDMVEAAVQATGESATKRILIVDDDPAYAKMVRGWIADDYMVNIVTNGMNAITFLTKNNVDLILLDYEMPVVDGPQVFEMIKSEEELAGIPVVFLTGNGTREGVERVMALKPAGYVLKGTTKQDLLTKIGGVLAKYAK